MGPTLVLSAPDGPHVGPRNFAIRDLQQFVTFSKIRDNRECCRHMTIFRPRIIRIYMQWLPEHLNLYMQMTSLWALPCIWSAVFLVVCRCVLLWKCISPSPCAYLVWNGNLRYYRNICIHALWSVCSSRLSDLFPGIPAYMTGATF